MPAAQRAPHLPGPADGLAVPRPAPDAPVQDGGPAHPSPPAHDSGAPPRRLEEEHDWLALTLSAGQMGLWEWNFSTGERRWNDTMYALYGVDRAQVTRLAPPHIEEILPEDAPRLQQEIARLRAEGGSTQVEFRIRRRDTGQVRWISSRGTMRRDPDGGNERMLGVSHDVTDRKTIEHRLIEADRRKDEFLAMLAHELRNPLAPLVNAHRLIEREAALSAPGREALAMAQRQARQLVRLVDDLLEIGRITRGKITLRPAPMCVADAVRDAAASVAADIAARGQRLEVSVPPQPVPMVGDAARIAQVLENLLHNASKYTPDGGSIRIELHEHCAEIELRVIDDGIGIEPDKLDGIFELFAQADASLDRSQGGLGIGLALVERLVGLHGGTVSAASAGRGRGSAFTVRLPR